MSGESRSVRKSGTASWQSPTADIVYFKAKLAHARSLGLPTDRIAKQLKLLEDAIVIYREQRLAAKTNGGTITESEGDFARRYAEYKNRLFPKIPNSLLVQTFMMKLRCDISPGPS